MQRIKARTKQFAKVGRIIPKSQMIKSPILKNTIGVLDKETITINL